MDLPPMPRDGRCSCGAVPYYVRPEKVGQAGYFECRARGCGKRYRFAVEPWTPGQTKSPASPKADGA